MERRAGEEGEEEERGGRRGDRVIYYLGGSIGKGRGGGGARDSRGNPGVAYRHGPLLHKLIELMIASSSYSGLLLEAPSDELIGSIYLIS